MVLYTYIIPIIYVYYVIWFRRVRGAASLMNIYVFLIIESYTFEQLINSIKILSTHVQQKRTMFTFHIYRYTTRVV